MSRETTTTPPPVIAGGVDLEKRPVAEVLAALEVQADTGLSGTEAKTRLDKYGPNALVEKQESLLSKLLGPFTGPIAYMIEASALVSAFLGRWVDFIVIAAPPSPRDRGRNAPPITDPALARPPPAAETSTAMGRDADRHS